MRAGFARRLAFGPPLVFDGGLSGELERRGFDLAHDLWTARALRDAPDLIGAVHQDHLRAGADVITTAGYQASVAGFRAAGASTAETEALFRRSVTLGREAIAAVGGEEPRYVAASCGPYGALMGGGREYDGDYGDIAAETLRDCHRERLELLVAEDIDLIIFETMPRLDEALIVADLLEDLGVGAALLSFQLRSADRLAGGDLLRHAIEDLNGRPEVIAFGLNCCPPHRAGLGLEFALERSLKPIVVQANSGERWDGRHWHPDEAGEDLVRAARRWLAMGARGIGACCRCGPEVIAELRALVPR